MPLTLTRQKMQEKLAQAFDPEQTASLVEVLDTFREAELERAADTRELKQGLATLTQEVRKLTTAQQRTDARLAEHQERTEEQFGRIDQRFVELAAAQTHLTKTVEQLAQSVGLLANDFGFSLEEFAAALLPSYLERYYGIRGLTLERQHFELESGEVEEVDLVGEGERDGRPVIVLAECRAKIGGGETRRLSRKLAEVAALRPAMTAVPIIVAMNIHPTAEAAAEETEILLLPYSRVNRDRR